MSSFDTSKHQLESLAHIVASCPLNSSDLSAWTRAKSRSSFRPSSPFPPLPAIPISGRSAKSRLFWRRETWSKEAPARLLPGFQTILEQSSGSLRVSCLTAIQYFRITHFRNFRPGNPTLPPLSSLERKLLPPTLISTLNKKPSIFSKILVPEPLPFFESIKIKETLKSSFPAHFNQKETLTKVDPINPDPSASQEISAPDLSVDQFSFIESFQRPDATNSRHKTGKRRSVMTKRFTSRDYIY